MKGEGNMLVRPRSIHAETTAYARKTEIFNAVSLYQDALQRADTLIEQQKQTIHLLKEINKNQLQHSGNNELDG